MREQSAFVGPRLWAEEGVDRAKTEQTRNAGSPMPQIVA